MKSNNNKEWKQSPIGITTAKEKFTDTMLKRLHSKKPSLFFQSLPVVSSEKNDDIPQLLDADNSEN